MLDNKRRLSLLALIGLAGCAAETGQCLPYARTSYDLRDHKEKPSAGVLCTAKPLITIK